jgi:biopolymer transport protein ExbB
MAADARSHIRRCIVVAALGLGLFAAPATLHAADGMFIREDGSIDVAGLLQAGGSIGWVIVALSVAMVALIIEHLLSIRRGSLMPSGLAEELHQLLSTGQHAQAATLARERTSYLGFVVAAALQETAFGYAAVEKALEDAAAEQAARLFRKIEYLSVIGVIAPMLGLMGTVWGMILAFGEFAINANPQPTDLAPAISLALVTTLQGLIVAVPALAAFAWFRSRVDEFVAEASLLAEHVLSPVKRQILGRRRTRTGGEQRTESRGHRPTVTPVAIEREPPP